MVGYFDTHAHLLDKRFDKDRFKVIDNMEGIVNIVEPGEDGKILDELLKNKKVWGAAGIHPHEARNFKNKQATLNKLLAKEKVVALGEIGLDFYYKNSEPGIQKEVFKQQMELAQNKNMPVIIHMRNAFKDTLDILKNYNQRVLIHCFSGSAKKLMQLLERDYYIAIGGMVTFSNASSLQDAVKKIPSDRLLTETDSPYLAPRPMRGKRNQPEYVRYITAKLARLKNEDEEYLKRVISENARRFFNINNGKKQ
ncbi:MAG: TatD family hydrolase [Elusimicrobia bacterium]|jgi:TatD DNase family protein|nr:TatD family hydrolase [Elusimicrobiota bacterium]